MAKIFKRTEFLRLKPFENEQKNTIPESGIVLNRKPVTYSASVFHLSSINISPGHVYAMMPPSAVMSSPVT